MSDIDREKKTVLVVDDSPENIDILNAALRPTYRVKAALNGEKAIRMANKHPQPDIVLLDIMMPGGMSGFDVCKVLKSSPITRKIPIIFISAKTTAEDEQKGLELGAADYISKPISPPIVKTRVRTQLALCDQNRELEQKVELRTKELTETQLEIIRRLGRAAEFKDNETGLHVIRMSHYARLIAEALSPDKQWSDLVFHASPMHDIGKIGIPDRILLKPAKLDENEWKIMKQHPEIGADIIGEHCSKILQMSKEIALTHHEKWDGSGYPNQLQGEDIPLTGRVVAIADVFDALTSQRPYKKAWPVEDAIQYIEENSGKHFDPSLVPLFREAMPEILDIKEMYEEKSVHIGQEI
ncbi:MAG: two-component system response regulator [Alteromonadaceae bacterium]|nr:MAG: two-component system response regulator [Alteromonadaceae bacterium]